MYLNKMMDFGMQSLITISIRDEDDASYCWVEYDYVVLNVRGLVDLAVNFDCSVDRAIAWNLAHELGHVLRYRGGDDPYDELLAWGYASLIWRTLFGEEPSREMYNMAAYCLSTYWIEPSSLGDWMYIPPGKPDIHRCADSVRRRLCIEVI